MRTTIKTFKDGSSIEYDAGRFDNWCVYLVGKDGTRKPPLDTEYFTQLKRLSVLYGPQKVYNDFVRIYRATKKSIEQPVLDMIDEIADSYVGDALEVNTVMTTLYMGMIAEENKANSILGKRVKRLGVHLVLIDEKDISYSANFMRGMRWYDIAAMCQERGF